MTDEIDAPDAGLAALATDAKRHLAAKARAERDAAEHALQAGRALDMLLTHPGGPEALAAAGIPVAAARAMAALHRAGLTPERIAGMGGTRAAIHEIGRRLRDRAVGQRADLDGEGDHDA